MKSINTSGNFLEKKITLRWGVSYIFHYFSVSGWLVNICSTFELLHFPVLSSTCPREMVFLCCPELHSLSEEVPKKAVVQPTCRKKGHPQDCSILHTTDDPSTKEQTTNVLHIYSSILQKLSRCCLVGMQFITIFHVYFKYCMHVVYSHLQNYHNTWCIMENSQ